MNKKQIILRLVISLMAQNAFAGVIVTDTSQILKQGADKYSDFLFVSRVIDYKTFDMGVDNAPDTPSQSVAHKGKRGFNNNGYKNNRRMPKGIKGQTGVQSKPNPPQAKQRPNPQSKPNHSQVQKRPNPQPKPNKGGGGNRGGGKKRR